MTQQGQVRGRVWLSSMSPPNSRACWGRTVPTMEGAASVRDGERDGNGSSRPEFSTFQGDNTLIRTANWVADSCERREVGRARTCHQRHEHESQPRRAEGAYPLGTSRLAFAHRLRQSRKGESLGRTAIR